MTAEYVTVRGVVYMRPRAGEGRWHRCSMPPDATPGKRSKWPPIYPASRLPAHEAVDAEKAKAMIRVALGGLDRVRAEVKP